MKFWWFLLVFFFMAPLWGEKHWALVMGVSEYPALEKDFPKLQYAATDAYYISQMLSSPHCRFASENVFLLMNDQAQKSKIKKIFRESFSQSSSEDLVFIFFSGHGFNRKKENEFFFLLPGDKGKVRKQTALGLKELEGLIQLIPAKKIFLCLDARRSAHALGSISWPTFPGKEVCLLESSQMQEIAKERAGRGFLAHFFLSGLRAIPYFGKTADENNDGLITVSEISHYLTWAMPFSGVHQHPVRRGKLDSVVFALPFYDRPHIQVITPKTVKVGQPEKVRIAGFIRDTKGVKSVEVEKIKARLGQISKNNASQWKLLPWPNTFWFSIQLNLTPRQRFIEIKVTNGQGEKRTIEHTILYRFKGWHQEWMPPGMKKGQEYGVYEWEKDRQEMVYVAGGNYIRGAPSQQLQQIRQQIAQLREYMEKYQKLLRDDRHLRELLVAALEQSNQAVNRIGTKLGNVYRKIELLDKVNRGDKNKERDKEIPKPSTLVESQQISQIREYFAESQVLLQQCYEEVRDSATKRYEISESLYYLTMLSRLQQNIEELWKPRVIQGQGFYIDRYEMSNKKYLDFCHATSRPYPPDPWWQSDYIWDSPEHPVVNVSWEDAFAYCLWSGKTLPRTAQWEKAARGTLGFFFPWGNQAPVRSLVNADVPPSPEEFSSDMVMATPLPMKVQTLPGSASPYGCYHMAGNVWEWCSDSPSISLMLLSARGPSHYRISKGGSFSSGEYMLSTWFEHPFPTHSRRSDLGFRCVVNFPEE